MNEHDKHTYKILCQRHLEECQISLGNFKYAVTLKEREEAVLQLVNQAACLHAAAKQLAKSVFEDDPHYGRS